MWRNSLGAHSKLEHLGLHSHSFPFTRLGLIGGPPRTLCQSQTGPRGHTLTLVDGSQGISQHEEPALFAQRLGYEQEAGTADVRGGPPAHGPQACQERPAAGECAA